MRSREEVLREFGANPLASYKELEAASNAMADRIRELEARVPTGHTGSDAATPSERKQNLRQAPRWNQGAYGFCPKCGAPGKLRERRPNGNDICKSGHTYPSSASRIAPEALQEPSLGDSPARGESCADCLGAGGVQVSFDPPASVPCVCQSEAPRGEAVAWGELRAALMRVYFGHKPESGHKVDEYVEVFRQFTVHPPVAAVVSEAEVERAVRRGRDFGFDRDFDDPDEYWCAIEAVLTAARGGA